MIVWFIWYGNSIKRKYQQRKNSKKANHSIPENKTDKRFISQYDYSNSSSINWPISNSFGLNQVCELTPTKTALRRANPVFNAKEDSETLNRKILNYDCGDDYSSNHSTSFVHLYKHRMYD